MRAKYQTNHLERTNDIKQIMAAYHTFNKVVNDLYWVSVGEESETYLGNQPKGSPRC